MTNEAPTKNEVESAFTGHIATSPTGKVTHVLRSEDVATIRAHIAALEAEKIAKLEHDVLLWKEARDSAMFAGERMKERIAALEAENKRLIDVLKDLVEIYRRDSASDPDLIATDRHREETWGKAKSAIAQTGEK